MYNNSSTRCRPTQGRTEARPTMIPTLTLALAGVVVAALTPVAAYAGVTSDSRGDAAAPVAGTCEELHGGRR